MADTNVPIDFGMGVDTKTDSKQVVTGKLLQLQDAVFTDPKSIIKRNGHTPLSSNIAGGGTLTLPQMVKSYNNEIVCQDQGLLYSYSSQSNEWIYKGPYISTEVSRTSIDQEDSVSGYTDEVIFGGYSLRVWSTIMSTSLGGGVPTIVLCSIVDLSTGVTIPITDGSTTTTKFPVSFGTAGVAQVGNPRAVILSNTTLAMTYLNPGATAILMNNFSISGGVATISAPVTISTAFSNPNNGLNAQNYDVVGTPTGGAVVYLNTAPGVTITIFNTTMVVNSVTIADATAFPPFHISYNAGNIWAYWCDYVSTVSEKIVYVVYNAALTVVVVSYNPATHYVYAALSPFIFSNLIAVSTSSTSETVYFGQFVTGGALFVDGSAYAQVFTDGTHSATTLFAFGITPYSRPFIVANNIYAVFVYRGSISVSNINALQSGLNVQATFFVVQLTPFTSNVPFVAARFGAGVANTQVFSKAVIGYNPNVTYISGSAFQFACGIANQEFLSDTFETTSPSFANQASAYSYTIDFASLNTSRAVNSGEILVMNGGQVQIYDGSHSTEWNFNLYPEIRLSQTTGGNIPDNAAGGAYYYLAIYQWTDFQGNLHQSTPSNPASITVAAGSGTAAVNVEVTDAFLSQKLNPNIAIYRTPDTASGASTIYYLVTEPTFLTYVNPLGTPTIIYKDTLANTSLPGNPNPYAYPTGSTLENTTPPPSIAMVAHNNRLWFVDAENRNNVWYTKSFSPGTGLSPSGFLLEELDPKLGNIVALSEMDEKLVILKQSGIVVQSGDGPNDTGTNSTLSFPQFVPSDVGCDQLKSVVTTPTGVMFHSPNGIYMLNRSLNVTYIGMEVEKYNAQQISSANLIQGKSQIRFLCTSGLNLLYDYIFSQWSTFTNPNGYSADIWQGNYAYATTSGKIFQEVSNTYLDNGVSYAMLLQTSWLDMAGVQGFSRVRRLILLGDYANGTSTTHGISVTATYDFNQSPNGVGPVIPYQFNTAANISGVLQYRERLPQQKCDTVSLLITEVISSGISGEYIDLENMSLEVAIKRGVRKMAGPQTVG